MLTNFSRFILILKDGVNFFLKVLIIFTVSSFQFQQVRLPWLYRQWWVAAIYPTSIYWTIRFGTMPES